jgi:hypothetical protein
MGEGLGASGPGVFLNYLVIYLRQRSDGPIGLQIKLELARA